MSLSRLLVHVTIKHSWPLGLDRIIQLLTIAGCSCADAATGISASEQQSHEDATSGGADRFENTKISFQTFFERIVGM